MPGAYVTRIDPHNETLALKPIVLVELSTGNQSLDQQKPCLKPL